MARRKAQLTMDHSGDREAPDAPAPLRPVTRAAGLTLLDAIRRAAGDPPRTAAHRVSLREALSRATAAAAKEVPYAWDSGAARLECASVVAMAAMLEARRESNGATDCPRFERVRMGHLRLRCRNWVLVEARRRDDVADAAHTETAETPMTATLVTERPAPGMPAWAARRAADELAERLGVPRAARLIYGALRLEDGERCAAELGMTHGSYRVAVAAGRTAIRAAFPSPRDLLAALLLLDAGGMPAGKRKRHPAEWRDRTDALGGPDTERGAVTARRRPGGRRKSIDRDTTGAIAELVYGAAREDRRLERTRGAHRHAGNGASSNR